MFWSLDYHALNFTDSEWDSMSRIDKVTIRDYVLNGYDREQTTIYNDYASIFQVRKVERQYDLERRPRMELSLAQFHLPD